MFTHEKKKKKKFSFSFLFIHLASRASVFPTGARLEDKSRLAKRGGCGHDERRGMRWPCTAVKNSAVPATRVRTLIAHSRKENRASPALVLVRTPIGPSCAVRYSQASGHVLQKRDLGFMLLVVFFF